MHTRSRQVENQLLLALAICLAFAVTLALGQSTKGAGNTRLSSSFVRIFNSLTPIQQQQFVRQMSSSNRNILQQMLFSPSRQFSSTEERFTSGGLLPNSQAATKTSKLIQQQQQQQRGTLSPIQQAAFIQSQQQFSGQGALPGGSSFNSEFQSSKSVSQAQPQEQSYFNRVQEVKQVSRPVVVPSIERSFRRVQSFSSQPLPVRESTKFVQQSYQQQQQQQPSSFASNQFSSSSSSSSNLAGGNGLFGSAGDAGGFSAALQQEKLDSGFLEQNDALQSHQNSENVFEDNVEQKDLYEGEFNGLMAAAIDNKWYIMKPIEKANIFGLRKVQKKRETK